MIISFGALLCANQKLWRRSWDLRECAIRNRRNCSLLCGIPSASFSISLTREFINLNRDLFYAYTIVICWQSGSLICFDARCLEFIGDETFHVVRREAN